jgi:NhaP-type Na+/H+ or K+/H+ antiporter
MQIAINIGEILSLPHKMQDLQRDEIIVFIVYSVIVVSVITFYVFYSSRIVALVVSRLLRFYIHSKYDCYLDFGNCFVL